METIDLKSAKDMVERYRTTRKTIIDKAHGINDTQSSWISIDAMKKFINDLPPEATGIRIHLGAHDETHKASPNQTSLVIIGTIAGTDDHIDAVQSDAVALKTGSGLEANNNMKDCPPYCK